MASERFFLPAQEYLARNHVLTYVEDALCQLIENKEELTQYGVAKFFAEYFTSVRHGTHILFREFSFIQATPHNRASFLRMFWKCFRYIGKNGDLLAMKEYHAILKLLSPDFPVDLTQKAARIVLMDDAMDCLMSFSDFLYAFQIQFYYSEFLETVAAIYQDLLSGKNPKAVIVPTSSSLHCRQRQASNENAVTSQEGVDVLQFCECLETLCERCKWCCPPVVHIKDTFRNIQRVTFYGFLMALAKSDEINKAIGALPIKADLLIDPEMDQELEKSISRLSAGSDAGSQGAGSSTGGVPKELARITSPYKVLRHRHRRADADSDGSTETDSSEN